MRMTGNTILVTGGTSGLGRALAERFHDGDNRVIVRGRRQALLDEITASRPGLRSIRLDLAEPDTGDALARILRANHPSLSVLVANAGISPARRTCARTGGAVGMRCASSTSISAAYCAPWKPPCRC